VLIQDDAKAARAPWRRVADQLRPKLPKLAIFLDDAEQDVLAYITFPTTHRDQVPADYQPRNSQSTSRDQT
jgi:transposase-like protein